MDLLHPSGAGEMSRQQKNATDPVAWRTVAQASERAARLWEAVARNVAGAYADGSDVLARQMLAHGLVESVPTDSEGAES
jgi:hypothetical protein